MYVQCTTYVSLCRRWRAYNRVILVQDVSVEPVASCGPSTADAAATEATTSSAAGASNHCAGKKNDKKTTTVWQSSFLFCPVVKLVALQTDFVITLL